jgi:hypothetical protein
MPRPDPEIEEPAIEVESAEALASMDDITEDGNKATELGSFTFDRAGYNVWGVSHKTMHRIIDRVIGVLAHRRKNRQDLHIVDKNGKHVHGSENSYIMDDQEVQNVVDAVVRELRCSEGNVFVQCEGKPDEKCVP